MDKAAIPSLDELAKKMAQDLEAAETRLCTAMNDVDVSAAFAAYAITRICGMAKEGPDEHSRPAPAAVELAAWTLFPEFGRGMIRAADRIQAVVDALEAYQAAFNFTEIFPVNNTEKHDHLAAHLRLHSGIVRGSAYPIQVVRLIEGVLRPFEFELEAIAGLGPWSACEIVKSIGAQLEENINGMRDAYYKTFRRAQALAHNRKNLSDAELAHVQELRDELNHVAAGLDGGWVPTWPQICARLPEVSRKHWDALRGTIGLTPSSRAALTKIVDVQDRPIFFLDEERGFYVHGTACFDAVFNFFDDLARCTPALRDRYGLRVAEWMEEQIKRHMLRLFPASAVLRNACFVDPDSPNGETEADVMFSGVHFSLSSKLKEGELRAKQCEETAPS